MTEASLPFLYRKAAEMFKDENANVARDFRITKKDLKIVKGELARQGILVIKRAGRKKMLNIKI